MFRGCKEGGHVVGFKNKWHMPDNQKWKKSELVKNSQQDANELLIHD